ncbi:MFS transporter [Paenirhodobacter sp.]|uniref:MFS transporter n=1 Tax=Paenirhodobacter sp. TaxID=1965326 RepID=UPI003B401EBD
MSDKNPVSREFSTAEETRIAFIAAWLLCSLFYFVQYALRSAPGVMLPELGGALSMTNVELSKLIGLYYYTYSIFALVSGAALDRAGAKYTVPAGIVAVGVGALLFGTSSVVSAEAGRLLQGAGSAMAFTGAVYLAAHGFPKAWLATAVGVTQCFGMLGGSVGQFAVAPVIHGMMTWQAFWAVSGFFLLVMAVGMMLVTPPATREERTTEAPWKPYKVVLSNPQSWICGLIGGLLFLPTTIFAMIWGVPFLREGLGLDYGTAVARASMVPLGWVLGCPLLGYVADRMGRRKPVIAAGAVLMLISGTMILHFPGMLPPYVGGLMLGIGSGAAMIPYTSIKELNPDRVKGSATGAMNFLVFTMTAVLNPWFGRILASKSEDGVMTLATFQSAGTWLLGGIVLAILLIIPLRESGSVKAQPARGN